MLRGVGKEKTQSQGRFRFSSLLGGIILEVLKSYALSDIFVSFTVSMEQRKRKRSETVTVHYTDVRVVLEGLYGKSLILNSPL